MEHTPNTPSTPDNVVYLRPPGEQEQGILPPKVEVFLTQHQSDIEQLPDELRASYSRELQMLLEIGEPEPHLYKHILDQHIQAAERGDSVDKVGGQIGEEGDLPPQAERNEIADTYEDKYSKPRTRRFGEVGLRLATTSTPDERARAAEAQEREDSKSRHPAFRKRTRLLKNQPVMPDHGDLPPGVTPLPLRRSGRYRNPYGDQPS